MKRVTLLSDIFGNIARSKKCIIHNFCFCASLSSIIIEIIIFSKIFET